MGDHVSRNCPRVVCKRRRKDQEEWMRCPTLVQALSSEHADQLDDLHLKAEEILNGCPSLASVTDSRKRASRWLLFSADENHIFFPAVQRLL
jgi:hypothetical protein